MKISIMHRMKQLDAETWEIDCKRATLVEENVELDKAVAVL